MAYRRAVEYMVSALAIGSAIALIIYAISVTNVTLGADNSRAASYRPVQNHSVNANRHGPTNSINTFDGNYSMEHFTFLLANTTPIIDVITLTNEPPRAFSSDELRRVGEMTKLSSRLRARSQTSRSLRLQRRNFTWDDDDLLGIATFSAFHDPGVAQETTAWKTLTSHPNSLVHLLPSRAMRVVQEVVRSFRQKDMHIIVQTKAGKVRGRYQKYRSGIKGGYYSFKGIRYGAPPIGDRRFRAAEPERSWVGIRDASREGANCPHKNMILDTFKGNEDCLFLNVFTARLPQGDFNPELPVMFWIHGGGYSFGSGNTFLYGPDYLVAEDVVLVTVNYRLGPLGFLTAGPYAPGNQGLKDQILALRWVQNNIAAFGGNPNSVTIFGESAGASSVQMLLLSPLSEGLFHRAISESGSALNPWSVGESSANRAIRLAHHLGYDDNSNATQDILDFLKRLPAMRLVEAAPTTLTEEDFRNNVGLPFVPVVEGYWNAEKSEDNDIFEESPFITETPRELYNKHKFHKNIPYMTGYNTHEAMLFIRRLRKNPELLHILENDFGRLVPQDLNITDEKTRVTREMRQFYLGTKHVGIESVDEMIALLTDLMFLQGIRCTARHHAKYGSAPVYMYRFSFDGALGLYKRMLGLQRPGVCHGDEMGYLFKFGFFNLKLDPNSLEVLVKNRMVRMWTNFAKYGNPTPPNMEDNLLTTTWLPINPVSVMDDLSFLDITDVLEMKSNPELERQQFWDYMYEHYNGNAI